MVKHYSDKKIKKMGLKYNKIFTAFQKLDPKVASWEPLKENTQDKWQMMLIYEQISEMRWQRGAYIILSIAILFMMALQAYVTLKAVN